MRALGKSPTGARCAVGNAPAGGKQAVGTCSASHLHVLLCAHPAEAEVAAIVKEVDPDGKGVIDFPGQWFDCWPGLGLLLSVCIPPQMV